MIDDHLTELARRYGVPDQTVFSPGQIAKLPLFGGAKSAIYSAIATGELPALAFPPNSHRPRYKISREDLLRWLAACVRQG